MKKTLIVAVLAVALVLAFASMAVARPNGNIYIAWSTANGTNNLVPTPHAGYTTSTEKCNVCHSVHYAAPSNYAWEDSTPPWTSENAETQMLLRSSVAGACNYCHITTAIGGVQLYGGTVTAYTSGSTFAHNSPSASCSGCHAVHGANTFQGPNVTKILRVRSDRPIQAEVVGVDKGYGLNTAITALYAGDAAAIADTPALGKYVQQVAFCTQCHIEYTTASEATISGSQGYYDGGYDGFDYKGHPMKVAQADGFVANGDTISVAAAFVGSGTCRSCHDAGGVDQTGITWNSFPHYTQGYFVFSYTGDYAGDQDAANNAKNYATDGNCLKCHIDATNVSGVGKSF